MRVEGGREDESGGRRNGEMTERYKLICWLTSISHTPVMKYCIGGYFHRGKIFAYSAKK